MRFWSADLVSHATPPVRQPPYLTLIQHSLLSLLGVIVTTIFIQIVQQFIDLGRVGIIYLMPVMIAALRWGLAPAIVAAVASVASTAYFFYQPIYSFEAHDWEHQVDLILFTLVAVVASQLATRIRRQAEIERLREAMIGSVSHELRTPLASILGAVSVVSQSPAIAGDERLSALTRMARDEIERLNDDIQNLLDASRISAQGIQAKSEGVDLPDVINAACERRERKLAHHRLEVELPDELPFAQGDPILIEQAIAQALDNAAKYSPHGSPVRVSAAVRGDNIVIDVTDEGPGIPEHEQSRAKERFFRGSSHAGTVPGSGLGLWIADAFVTACGGQLSVNSRGNGHGTTVSITLPVVRTDPSDAEANEDD